MADVVRYSRPSERDQLVAFVAAMGFTPRHPEVWDGLGMIAATYWHGDRLIGAIPLEPRKVLVGGAVIDVVQETVVGVHPDWRNQGIGSAMQALIAAQPPGGATHAMVYREEADSGAYKWYRANGFEPIGKVWSYLAESLPSVESGSVANLRASTDAGIPWQGIETLRRADAHAWRGCMVDPANRALAEWLPLHPYRQRYRYHVAWVSRSDGTVGAYAVFGVGKVYSETDRLEILEFAAADAECAATLINGVIAHGARLDLRPLRWVIADGDEALQGMARSLGMTRDFSIDLLCRPLTAAPLPDMGDVWRAHGLDYI